MKIKLIFIFKQRQLVSLMLLLAITGWSFSDAYSQNTNPKPSRQSSIQDFSEGKYELAYNQFSELLLLYPKDPLYKYYLGVCLVKLNREPEKASTLLQQALQGAAVIRTLPSDAAFYLGRAQQMSGNFKEAVESFTKFSDISGKKVAKDYNVSDYIQQCGENKGKLIETDTVIKKEAEKEKIVTIPKEVEKEKVVTIPKEAENGRAVMYQAAAEKEKPVMIRKEEEPVSKIIKQPPVEKNIINQPALPHEYEKLAGEALKLQSKADSLGIVVAKQKQSLGTVPDFQREASKKRISEIELLAASYQKNADIKFREAETLKPGSKVNFKPAAQVNGVQEQKVRKQDTIIKGTERPVSIIAIYSVFEVKEKPVYSVGEKVIIDPDVPPGLVYRIQMAVFRNPVATSYFKGISPVYGFRATGKDLTIYYAGMFRKSSDAAKALIAVKAKGFKDAFVVAYSEKKIVSAERAVVLEKEWGKVPLVKEIKPAPEIWKDTLPPTLTFRIEVMRTVKPLKDDITEGIKKIAGNRGLDILTADDGKFVYLIGKFITFESAAEYNDLLIRNGYREAKVVAWLGKNELPVDTARELFDKLE